MEKGFTLIEVLTTISILLILGGFFWVAIHFILKFW